MNTDGYDMTAVPEGTFAAGRQAGRAADTVEGPITDETGLTGLFALTLEWNADPLARNADPSLPNSVTAALQDQLGLKLEARRTPQEVVIIDRINRPTEN